MKISSVPLKKSLSVMFLALFALTACGGGGSSGGGGSAAPAGPFTYTQMTDRGFGAEQVDFCTAWDAKPNEDIIFVPHANRQGESHKVTFFSEQRYEMCVSTLDSSTGVAGDDINGFTLDLTLASNGGNPEDDELLCHYIANVVGVSAIANSSKLYKIQIPTGAAANLVGAFTQAQLFMLCNGDSTTAITDGNSYATGYLDIGEMQAVVPPPVAVTVGRNQPALEILRQSSINLSHLFQRGAMEGNVINSHDAYGNAVTFTPLQAQSVKASYALSDAMHDLTFTATEDEIFSNEQARLAFTSNKHDDTQSDMHATYQSGNMFMSADYSPLIKQTDDKQMFLQISDSANDVGTLRVSHKLGDRLTFTQKAGTGTFATGNRFDEVSTALSYQKANKNLSIGTGRLREYDQFLGSVTTGAYALDEATESAFVSLHADMSLGKNVTMQANYSAMNSAVSLHHDDFVRINGLRSDSYDVKLQSKMKSGKLSLQYLVPLAVTDGTWQQRNVINLQDTISREDLSVNQRHEQWQLRYQSDGQHHSHVFATLTRDENYSNIAGLNETRVMAGLSKKF